MNAKNTNKSPIHENAAANITCDFGVGDITRFRSRLLHGHIVSSIIVRFHVEPPMANIFFKLPTFTEIQNELVLFAMR